MIELIKGTIEHVPINVKDRLNSLTDLAGTSPTYFVRREADPSDVVITERAADLTTPAGMVAYCLIDTTTIDQDRYELCLRFQLLPEVPLLVFDFMVV